MESNLTGTNLRAYFQKCSSENNKVFLVGSSDEAIANSLAGYFQNLGVEKCKECIDYYIKHTRPIAVSLTEFAVQLTDIIAVFKQREDSQAEIDRVMQRTKERMEGLK